MRPKKKTKRKQTKSNTSVASKKIAKKTAVRKRSVKAKASKKLAKKKPAQEKRVQRTKPIRKKSSSVNSETEVKREIRNRRTEVYSGRQSGILQGLSRAEEADSESVEELIEEGNTLEAGVVSGVEEADNADEREVHTHEVPEDDVPEEYFDKE
jgi:hypothetical protein